ncbi:MAG: hypothetical protein WKF66_19045 [Pedobacter sp.]
MHSNAISYLEELSFLEHQLQLKFGKRIITYNDCHTLSQDVFKKTGSLISSQTFRRFFKLIKSTGCISRSTADILSIYCGYSNFGQLVNQQLDLTQPSTGYQEAEIYKAFFEVEVPAIAKGEFNAVYSNAISGILKRVFSDKYLYDMLIPMISENPTAHNYFFEHFPYISGLGKGFGQGYTLYLKYKKDPEAQVFGNAMLFLSALLQRDYPTAKMYHNVICTIDLALIKHPFVIARYLGTKILNQHINGEADAKQQCIELVIARLKAAESVNQHGFHSFDIEFELAIAEYLSLAGCFDLVIDILLPVYEKKHLITDGMDKGFWLMPMKIMLIRAFAYTNRFTEANELIPLVGEINWLVEDYFNIQLLDAKIRMVTDATEQAAIGSDLTRPLFKTGFSYFEPIAGE